ncbi:hypothetical protein NE686_17725 [Tissierella carlieri]|uniref:Uncharacterized protein n=1 Tax=Tissierella carlieri TaxID=689904 RepID=A0ABT1SEV7_9FIRM|nr:hypothetical protein [Tissierella carlieri]MCQ4924944.1 hypothetical protein [Tissierella carlieri]
MRLTDILSEDQINKLILKTLKTKSVLEELYLDGDLKVFDSDKELFYWLNEGESTWEDYLSDSLDEMIERLTKYKGRGLSTLDSMIADRMERDRRIYIIGKQEKLIFIY